MKDRWIIWGAGRVGQALYNYLEEQKYADNIIYVVDSDNKKWEKIWNGHKIEPTSIVSKVEFDKLIIAVSIWRPIYRDLVKIYGIQEAKIDNYKFLQRKSLIDFYESTSNKSDEIIKQLKYIRNNPLDTFNDDFVDKYTNLNVDVQWDKSKNMHYVFHFGKKMYFPRKFCVDEITAYYRSIRMEQDILSPHKYQNDEFFIDVGESVLDIGVAEGNFSLEIVDKVKCVYMVEADEVWMEALKNTFAPYKNKVHIIHQYVGDVCKKGSITIDKLAKEVPFTSVKMDIEGAEINALRGGEETFRNHSVKAFICSYHGEDDYKEISAIMERYGYHVKNTQGYMVYMPYTQLRPMPKLVRGIIQAYK